METVAWVLTYFFGMAFVVKMGCDIIDIIKDRRNRK